MAKSTMFDPGVLVGSAMYLEVERLQYVISSLTNLISALDSNFSQPFAHGTASLLHFASSGCS